MKWKCSQCFWQEAGGCYQEEIAKITMEGGKCVGEKVEDNDDLLERCKLNIARKKEIKNLEKKKSEIEARLDELYNQSFKPGEE